MCSALKEQSQHCAPYCDGVCADKKTLSLLSKANRTRGREKKQPKRAESDANNGKQQVEERSISVCVWWRCGGSRTAVVVDRWPEWRYNINRFGNGKGKVKTLIRR